MSSTTPETGHAYHAEVTFNHLAMWLSRLDFTMTEALLYLEHWQRLPKDLFASLPAGVNLNDWEQGRLFCPAFELRWHRRGEAAILLLLTEGQVPALCPYLAVWETAGTYPCVSPARLQLVGTYYEKRGGFFAEASIPHEFRYPMDTRGLKTSDRAHAVLQGKHYGRNGKVLLTRITCLQVERGQQGLRGGQRQ